MVRNTKLPDIEVLRQHLRDGKTVREIGAMYGASGEAVRLRLKRAGVEMARVRADHSHYVPWRVRADHAHDAIAKRLRAYSKRQQGLPLDDEESQRLDEWLKMMDGDNPHHVPLSVHYSRHDRDGFWLEPKKPGDRDYISPPVETS